MNPDSDSALISVLPNLISGHTLPPFSVAYVKGWRRSVSCLIICEAIKELGIDMADLTTNYKAMALRIHWQSLVVVVCVCETFVN